MPDKFVSALDKVGEALKWFFTNKTAAAIEQTGLSVAAIAFPAADTLILGLQKSLATAQGLAAVNTAGDTTSQVTAIILADAQQLFTEYEQETNTQIETPQQQAIIAAIIALFSNLPAAAPGTVASASVKKVLALTAPKPAPVPSVQTQTQSGTLL